MDSQTFGKGYSKEHTKQAPNKSHETTISLGEGLPVGSVHAPHTKEHVKDAKDNRAPHAASHAQRERAIAGNANPHGEGTVGKYTGHAPVHKMHPEVIKASRVQRERAIASKANPMGEDMPTDQFNNVPSHLK